jgi:hypothetical protein
MASPSYPEFLLPAFPRHVLEQPDVNVAVLDTRFRLLWVNPAWDEFALANNGRAGVREYPTYLEAIQGPLRAHFTAALEHALGSGEVFEQDYECSSPDVLRQFHMRVLPFASQGLVVEHTLVASSQHEDGEAAIERHFTNDDGLIVQCSNCRRVRRLGITETWAWVPAWVSRSHPRTSHGLCSPCTRFYWGKGRRQ